MMLSAVMGRCEGLHNYMSHIKTLLCFCSKFLGSFVERRIPTFASFFFALGIIPWQLRDTRSNPRGKKWFWSYQ